MRHSGLSMQPGAAPVAWPPTARRTRPNWLLVLLGVGLHLLIALWRRRSLTPLQHELQRRSLA